MEMVSVTQVEIIHTLHYKHAHVHAPAHSFYFSTHTCTHTCINSQVLHPHTFTSVFLSVLPGLVVILLIGQSVHPLLFFLIYSYVFFLIFGKICLL